MRGKKNFQNIKIYILYPLIVSLITGYIGYKYSDLTYDRRKNNELGLLKIINSNESENSKNIISLEMKSRKNEVNSIKNIEYNKKYYFTPGQYEYKIILGPILIKNGYIEIERKKEKEIELDFIPKNIFYFSLDLDKEKYNVGENIFARIFSTEYCYVYLFYYDGESYINLKKDSIVLEPYIIKQVEKLYANSKPGNDNLIGIAIKNDDINYVWKILNNFSNKKSQSLEDQDWIIDWEKFTVGL